MPRFQYPNPLDLMFFASDQAARRIGLPTLRIHAHLDLGGRLDVGAFKRALTALYRVYPTAAARRELSLLTGRPRWRLDADPPDLTRVVRMHTVEPATEEQLHRQIEDLFDTHIDAANLPPVRFHVFRGLSRGDVLVMRWPHALMDARGGAFVLEEIDRLHLETPDPNTLTSAGDELRDDFAQLLAKIPLPRRAKMVLDWLAAPGARPAGAAQLAHDPAPARLGRMRYLLRHLTAEQTRQVYDNALRLCGFARFGDYLRACAIHALHGVMPKPVGPRALYTTLNLIDNRQRRRRGPVCWNLTSALPIAVPARLADNRRLVADLIRDQTLAHLASETTRRGFVTLLMLMRVPTALATAVIRAGETAGRSRAVGSGLVPAPSLPLGLLGPFSRPMPTFCGAELLNCYGFRTARPQPGFAVDVNTPENRINISGAYFESRVRTETMAALLDAFVASLLDPRWR